MMAAKADRIVWGGDSGQPWGTTQEVILRVTTLPSLVEIDKEIRRQSSGEPRPEYDRINFLEAE